MAWLPPRSESPYFELPPQPKLQLDQGFLYRRHPQVRSNMLQAAHSQVNDLLACHSAYFSACDSAHSKQEPLVMCFAQRGYDSQIHSIYWDQRKHGMDSLPTVRIERCREDARRY